MLGYTDTQALLYNAKRAEELGMKIMVVFHYSDHFADPLIQDVPSEWKGASESELEQYVYDYTAYIMEKLAEEGVHPEWYRLEMRSVMECCIHQEVIRQMTLRNLQSI